MHIFAFIFIAILVPVLYIRAKYRFWCIQPVFHFYDLQYWLAKPHIIRNRLPDKNKYVNLSQISVLEYSNTTDIQRTDFALLVRLNYLRDGNNSFLPSKSNIVPYFEGHFAPCFLSFYKQPRILTEAKTGKMIHSDKTVGVMSSRPLHVILDGATFDVYYVDYLCVEKHSRGKAVAPQLIQTHEYVQRNTNKNISICLFKREEQLTSIIPITIYQTHCFNARKWSAEDIVFSEHTTVIVGDSQNIHYMYQLIHILAKKWRLIALPDATNLIGLVATGNMFVQLVIIGREIEAAYIFKKSCLFIDAGAEILVLTASVQGKYIQLNEFVDGFIVAACAIMTANPAFKYVIVEDVGDNVLIVKQLKLKNITPVLSSPTAYFFYNFMHNTVSNQDCLIIT